MFTGLIEATGTIASVAPAGQAVALKVRSLLSAELSPGDSVAVNGVCLTVTATTPADFDATISPETLRVTTLGQMRAGGVVNLERPLKADGRLGGHFVLGHVDGMARIRSLEPDGDCYWVELEMPEALAALMIPKGSVAVDGISLTVAALEGARVRAQIVPFTWTHTSLSSSRAGDLVNIEADVIGKYVARLLGDRVSQLVRPDTAALTK
jgi:riboflavin synthase